MRKVGWICFALIFSKGAVFAQRSFQIDVSNKSRSYLVASSNAIDLFNQPLVIVLHEKDHLNTAFGSEKEWRSVSKPVLIAFPMVSGRDWDCNDKSTDSLFVSMLIVHLQNQFRANRHSILLVGSENSICLVQKIKSEIGSEHIKTTQLSPGFRQPAIVYAIDEWVNALDLSIEKNPLRPRKSRVDSILTAGFSSVDSIKLHSWHKRRTLSVSTGGFYFLPNAIAPTDYTTYINVANSNSYLSFQYSSWGSDSLAFFLDVGLLGIPQKQDINLAGGTASVTVGGGLLSTFVGGFKYAFYRHKARPYVAFGAGPMSMIIFGGKFEAGNMAAFGPSDGGVPPSSSNLKMASRLNMIAIIESGMDLRLSKRFYTSFNIRYSHSGSFENAGGINSVRAIGANVAIGFILGANKEVE
jgi:outer membrane protein W